MPPAARVAWEDVAALFAPLRVLTRADRLLVELVAVTYTRWRDAEAVVDKEGAVFKTQNGYPTPNPAAAMASGARAIEKHARTG